MNVWKRCGHPKVPSNTYAPGPRERCAICHRSQAHARTRAGRVTDAGDLAVRFSRVRDVRAMVDRLLHLEELQAMAQRLGGSVT